MIYSNKQQPGPRPETPNILSCIQLEAVIKLCIYNCIKNTKYSTAADVLIYVNSPAGMSAESDDENIHILKQTAQMQKHKALS